MASGAGPRTAGTTGRSREALLETAQQQARVGGRLIPPGLSAASKRGIPRRRGSFRGLLAEARPMAGGPVERRNRLLEDEGQSGGSQGLRAGAGREAGFGGRPPRTCR